VSEEVRLNLSMQMPLLDERGKRELESSTLDRSNHRL
jgi:hypothetical protein